MLEPLFQFAGETSHVKAVSACEPIVSMRNFTMPRCTHSLLSMVLSPLLVATGLLLLVASGCSVESKSESCTYNGHPIDCAKMPGAPGQSTFPDPGSPDSRTSIPPVPGSSGDSVFACETLSCHSGTQFCLKSVTSSGSTATTECAALKAGDDCSTLPALAKKRFGTSNNCSGFITCSQHNSEFNVSCQIPD